MVSTRSASTSKLRQSKINFKSTPGTQSSPIQARASRAATGSSTPQKVVQTKPRSNFLGGSRRTKQTYFADSSDDESDPRPPPRDAVDSENLMATQKGKKAVFVYDETDSDEEDDIPIATSSVRKRKRPAPAVVSSDEESEESIEATSPPAKFRKTSNGVDEEDDLADDMDFLRSSPPAITARSAKSKKDERAKALEGLKRQREKRKPKVSPAKKHRKVVSDSDDESLVVMSDNAETDSDQEGVGAEEDDDGGEEDADAFEVFDEHEADRDFIASDTEEEDTLGVPTTSIPIAFTGWATAKPRELFKFAVEWFVHKRINPAFDRDDDLYKLTWQKLNDEITGLVGSKYTSSAWTRDFTYALRNRPRIHTNRIEWDGTDCEACGRSGHPATYQIQFSGLPYDTHTYEDLEQDEEDEEAGITRDVHKSVIPPESRTYAMGKTCFGNAQMAHRLKHWRYSLGEWVMDYLNEIKELTPEKIVQRDGWKTAKRRDYANAIVQRMEDGNEIQQLYKAMKGEVSSARGAEDWDQ